MPMLSIKDIAHQAFSNPGVGEKNTISNGPDDGTNNCQTSHWWNPMRHGSTGQLVDNVLSAHVTGPYSEVPKLQLATGIMSTGGANVVGHGNDGVLETGMGQNGAYDTNKILLVWNETSWGPQFDRINSSGITYISIWSCHTGAGQDGADLLYGLARHSGRAVRAGTGFLYCNSQSFWWENGSQWQVATPTNKPAPIQAPSPHFVGQNLMLELGGRPIKPNEVESLEITHVGINRARVGHFTYTKQAAQSILSSLILSPPIDFTSSSVAAMVTAHLVVSLSDKSVIKLDVYNDRLAIEEKTRTGFYIRSVAGLTGG
jgi:hypothetical protein